MAVDKSSSKDDTTTTMTTTATTTKMMIDTVPVVQKTPAELQAEANALVLADIKNNITLLERSVSEIESRYTTRVLRSTGSFRRRLNSEIVNSALNAHLPKESHTRMLLHAALDIGDVMEIDDANGHVNGAPTILPEVEIYLGLVVVLYLHDHKHYAKGKDLTSNMITTIQLLNRRTMDQIAARVYFYLARFYEFSGDFARVRPLLLAAHRTATLRHDPDTQATVLNLLLRSYLSDNLYDQADKLISKAAFPESAPHNQHARFLYYQGRIKAIQLDYTEANRSLQQAVRKAPQTVAAAGFQQSAHKLAIIVQLLMGDIPERSIFRQPMLRKALQPYFEITQAVRSGNVNGFPRTVDEHRATFLADKTYTLILRLRQNVIKAGLRRISIAYSAISLREICEKLKLDSEQDAEYIVAKSIRDGVIDAIIVHEKGYMKSKEIIDIYSTNEPQNQFHQRISFCLDLHNESVKALRFPMTTVNKELASTNEAREEERKLAREIADGEMDEDEDMGEF